jgi:hypothetical protein
VDVLLDDHIPGECRCGISLRHLDETSKWPGYCCPLLPLVGKSHSYCGLNGITRRRAFQADISAIAEVVRLPQHPRIMDFSRSRLVPTGVIGKLKAYEPLRSRSHTRRRAPDPLVEGRIYRPVGGNADTYAERQTEIVIAVLCLLSVCMHGREKKRAIAPSTQKQRRTQ